MTHIITVPRNLEPASLIPFSVQLKNLPEEESYLFDFSRVQLTEPFGMLFLAAIIRQFVKERRRVQGREIEIAVQHHKDKTYASYMGLFKSMGVNHGNEPGQAAGSGTYIPLTRMSLRAVSAEARSHFRRDQEVLEKEAERIAKVLCQGKSGPMSDALSYSICELMRNVVEHGDASHLWYAAQYWPTKGRVEFALLDEGIGLTQSLRRNPKLMVPDDGEAIRQALLPGVSGVARPSRVLDGDWMNTGYGLYMISSICKRAGSLTVCNYTSALNQFNDDESFEHCGFDGVAVRIVVNVTKLDDLSKMLSDFRKSANACAD